jgi:phosphoglycerate dehydrogenase-like enzyme
MSPHLARGVGLIAVAPPFDAQFPFAAEFLHDLWRARGYGPTSSASPLGDTRKLGDLDVDAAGITRVVALGIAVAASCTEPFVSVREALFVPELEPAVLAAWSRRLLSVHHAPSDRYWGQSVAEFALALTLCGLRRIPQTYSAMITDSDAWRYEPPPDEGVPGGRGLLFGDDPRFVNGTAEHKRVRIAGFGEAGMRYARMLVALGADVAAWDPFVDDARFIEAGVQRVASLDALVHDADVMVPMLPLTQATRSIVTGDHISHLPHGALVVMAARAMVCDMTAMRARVLADELALAADVFDVEPLPLDDPLLGRHNVVHTPHNAGRTIDANRRWAELVDDQFIG